jgi:hypothetical protein
MAPIASDPPSVSPNIAGLGAMLRLLLMLVISLGIPFFGFPWLFNYICENLSVGGIPLGFGPRGPVGVGLKEVRRIGPFSALKVGALAGLFMGLLSCLAALLRAARGGSLSVEPIAAPVLGMVVGGVAALIHAVAYNLFARLVGGVKVQI